MTCSECPFGMLSEFGRASMMQTQESRSDYELLRAWRSALLSLWARVFAKESA